MEECYGPFNIGDRVIALSERRCRFNPSMTPEMRDAVGRHGTVYRVVMHDHPPVKLPKIHFDGDDSHALSGYIWAPEWLELENDPTTDILQELLRS